MANESAKKIRSSAPVRWDKTERRAVIEERLRTLVETTASTDPFEKRKARARLRSAYDSGDTAMRELIENLIRGRQAFAQEPGVTEHAVSPRRIPETTRPSDDAVRHWMRTRVDNWPDDVPAPSEQNDWEAAQQYFAGGLNRSDFRFVRDGETPPEWRKQGPRMPWGRART